MRLRFNKNAHTILENEKNYFVNTESIQVVNPSSLFELAKNDLHLEIGCGKGDFIINNAIKYPETNFIALERNETILAKAIKKTQDLKLKNLKFISCDAEKINELFKNHSFNKIYLNFSDPWPKARHAKRRLTHPSFLQKYKLLLKQDGYVVFKTDNDSLYSYTINDVLIASPNDYQIIYSTNDLYSNLNEFDNCNNIATEYEKKFHNLNKNIYKIVFSYK